MKYMLDTNTCIYLIRKRPVNVLKNLQKYKVSDVCISSIALSELEYGLQKSSNINQNKLALMEFMTPFEVLPFTELAAETYGIIRAALERTGEIIGAMDLLTAAHALSEKLILITNNTREFVRVSGLQIENWV